MCLHAHAPRNSEICIRLVPLALAAGGHQLCSDVPPQSLRHWFTLPPPIFGMRNLHTCPLLGCQFSGVGFGHTGLFSLCHFFTSRHVAREGAWLPEAEQPPSPTDTGGQSPARRLRLSLLLRGFTASLATSTPQPCKPSHSTEGIHAKETYTEVPRRKAINC